MGNLAYDKNGIPIEIGDTLKIFHFIGGRKKKYYMYKFVEKMSECGRFLIISHLSKREGSYRLLIDNKKLDDIEIVQGYGDVGQEYMHYEDRERMK